METKHLKKKHTSRGLRAKAKHCKEAFGNETFSKKRGGPEVCKKRQKRGRAKHWKEAFGNETFSKRRHFQNERRDEGHLANLLGNKGG